MSEPDTDFLEVLYLYESFDAIYVLTLEGNSFWIPKSLIEGEWIRIPLELQDIEVKYWYIKKNGLGGM